MVQYREHADWLANRILIVVPHQDDEILMTAGVIRAAVKKGASVTVVMATNGDCGCTDFSVGRARLAETVKGLHVLGLGAEHLRIMGYADTGMPKEDSFLHRLYGAADEEQVFPSSCSSCTYGLAERSEYHMERYGTHAPYCRRSFLQDLKELISEICPEQIFTTAQCDTHGDHSALFRFVCEALDGLRAPREEIGGAETGAAGEKAVEACGAGASAAGENAAGAYGEEACAEVNAAEMSAAELYGPQLYVGLVHSPAGDDVWPRRGTAEFDCPAGLEAAGLSWNERIRFVLPEEMRTARGEANVKYQALCQYETALEPNAVDFLMAFVKDEEIFWRVR